MMRVKGICEKNVYFYYIILRLTGCLTIIEKKIIFYYNNTSENGPDVKVPSVLKKMSNNQRRIKLND